jgi:uncharacterized protein (TIGR00369 family)
MSAPPDARSGDWQEFASSASFLATIGPLLRRHEGDAWAYALTTDARHLNGFGVIHGGVITSFADTALALAMVDRIGPARGATIQLNVQFIDAVMEGERMEARPEMVRATRSIVFMRGLVTVGDRTVAVADGVWKIFPVR